MIFLAICGWCGGERAAALFAGLSLAFTVLTTLVLLWLWLAT
jgi:hypothetical protein